MKTINRCFTMSVLTGLGLAGRQPGHGATKFRVKGSSRISRLRRWVTRTVGAINSAIIFPHVFNDAPASVGTYNNSYPGSISLSEANVNNGTGNGLERDVWYFSNNGGASPIQFPAGDYFTASFSLTLSGGVAGKDLEGGFMFSNPCRRSAAAMTRSSPLGKVGMQERSSNSEGLRITRSPPMPVVIRASVERSKLHEWCNVSLEDSLIRIDPSTGMHAFQYSVTPGAVRRKSAPGTTTSTWAVPSGAPATILGAISKSHLLWFRNHPCWLSWAWAFCHWYGCCAVAPETRFYLATRHDFYHAVFFSFGDNASYCASTRFGSGPRRRQKMTRRGNRLRLNSLKRSPTLPVRKLIYQIVK